jgi:type IV pilus assembly protein PilQ
VSQDVLAKGITIQAYKPTNSIFIRHYEADIERIKKLIRERFDIPLPQVKIEARMEILDRSAYEGIGVQWGGAGAGNINNHTAIIGQGFQTAPPPASRSVPEPDGTTLYRRDRCEQGNSAQPSGPEPLPTPHLGLLRPASRRQRGQPALCALPGAGEKLAGGISFGFVSGSFNINSAAGARRTGQDPHRRAGDRHGGEFQGLDRLGEKSYATVSSAGTQIQFKEAVLKLDVVPTVLKEQAAANVLTKIKMVVVVENNSRGDEVTSGVPAINKRKAETQVLIKEGDRLVIGGVTQNLSTTSVRKVPIFGDIPVLGWLFKQKANSEAGRELVIFVTPSLVTGQGGAGMAATPIAPK